MSGNQCCRDKKIRLIGLFLCGTGMNSPFSYRLRMWNTVEWIKLAETKRKKIWLDMFPNVRIRTVLHSSPPPEKADQCEKPPAKWCILAETTLLEMAKRFFRLLYGWEVISFETGSTWHHEVALLKCQERLDRWLLRGDTVGHQWRSNEIMLLLFFFLQHHGGRGGGCRREMD